MITLSLIHEIQYDWYVSKLLITDNTNLNYLAYRLGFWGIYIHSYKPIITNRQEISKYNESNKHPTIVDVRSPSSEHVERFILNEPQFKAYKIFKHGINFYSILDSAGLCANTVKNMLHMFKEPKTFYIDCDSEDLREFIYTMAVRFNEENKTGHSFDFEKYDYKLTVKSYDTYDFEGCNSGTTIITILTSKDIRNAWNQVM